MQRNLRSTAFLLLSFAGIAPAAAQKKVSGVQTVALRTEPKFLEGFDAEIKTVNIATPESTPVEKPVNSIPHTTHYTSESFSADNIEAASVLQLKYAVLLNTEVEYVQDQKLFETIEDWYGTPYVLGGSTKKGIDCSAFTQMLCSQLFQMSIPRTAREQYDAAQRISRTELKQGDLVFFNTRGKGVTHVGIYLQNNKFVHASTSGGVMISDLFEDYWAKRFLGAGRMKAILPLAPLLPAQP